MLWLGSTRSSLGRLGVDVKDVAFLRLGGAESADTQPDIQTSAPGVGSHSKPLHGQWVDKVFISTPVSIAHGPLLRAGPGERREEGLGLLTLCGCHRGLIHYPGLMKTQLSSFGCREGLI